MKLSYGPNSLMSGKHSFLYRMSGNICNYLGNIPRDHYIVDFRFLL